MLTFIVSVVGVPLDGATFSVTTGVVATADGLGLHDDDITSGWMTVPAETTELAAVSDAARARIGGGSCWIELIAETVTTLVSVVVDGVITTTGVAVRYC